jgi:hypothetical protein
LGRFRTIDVNFPFLDTINHDAAQGPVASIPGLLSMLSQFQLPFGQPRQKVYSMLISIKILAMTALGRYTRRRQFIF